MPTKELKGAIEVLSEPVKNLANPITTSAGQSLKDIWDLVFGGFHNFVEKKRVKREKDLIDFRDSLYAQVSQIPEESLKEPELSIVGPALEASKFYYEEPQLREMFARLIASSMDTRKDTNIHPCFVEIIKQLSPNDANLLLLYKEKNSIPVCNITVKSSKDKDSFNFVETNVYVSEAYPNMKSNQLSLTSLNRSALINISFENQFADTTVYEQLLELSGYAKKNDQIGWKAYDSINGFAELTPLGKSFIDVCL